MNGDVVIPARNNAATLPRVLAALAAQVRAGDRVVVVDDGSTDATVQVLAAAQSHWGDRLRVVRQRGAGPAAARNSGVAAGDAPLLAFLGADCLPGPHWLQRHRDIHRQFPEDTVGCVGWVSWDPELPPTPLMVWAEHGGDQNAFGLIAGQEWVSPRQAAYGANLSVKRSLFERAGGYDAARFPDYGWEDLEFGLRLEARGLRLRYEPSARVFHAHRYAAADVLVRAEAVGRSLPALVAVHPVLGPLPVPRGVRRLVVRAARGLSLDRAARVLTARASGRWILPMLYHVVCRFSFLEGLSRGRAKIAVRVDKLSKKSVRFSPSDDSRNMANISQKVTDGGMGSTRYPHGVARLVHNSVHTASRHLDGESDLVSPPASLQDVAVIVLHYGDPRPTLRTLDALRAIYPGPGSPRVFLVENGSLPGNVPAAAAERIVFPENVGYARANNAGMRAAFAAGAQLAVLLNNDVLVAPGILEAMRQAADAADAGLVGTTLEEAEGRVAGGGRVSWWRLQARLARTPVSPDVLHYLHGACLGITRVCWERIGPLPEDLFLYWEDVAYGLRVRAAGLRFAVVRSPVLRHARAVTPRDVLDDKTYYLVRNALSVVSAEGPSWAGWWARGTLPLRRTFARARGRTAVADGLADARAGRHGRRPGRLPTAAPVPVMAEATRCS